MNKLNMKKFIPCLVSIVVVAAMAIQSYATGIDVSAFIDIDTYLAKYNEIDWRIEEIEKNIERMYKFTCTNVKSFAGTAPRSEALNNFPSAFYMGSYNSIYPSNNTLVALFDDPKYIRVNKLWSLTYGGTGSGGSYRTKTITLKRDFPASMCKWKDGIELQPTAKINFNITYGLTGTNTQATTLEVVMGPFKKFPKYTSYGAGTGTGYICEIPEGLFGGSIDAANCLYYATNKESVPTSWTSVSSTGLSINGNRVAGVAGESKFPAVTSTDIENWGYSVRPMRNITKIHFTNSTFAPDLSTSDNVWIRFYYSTNGASLSTMTTYTSLRDFTITDWNVR
jgi:hypothetical protein